MTIEEYKRKFLELFKQVEEEHGPVEYIETHKDVVIKNEGVGLEITKAQIHITF